MLYTLHYMARRLQVHNLYTMCSRPAELDVFRNTSDAKEKHRNLHRDVSESLDPKHACISSFATDSCILANDMSDDHTSEAVEHPLDLEALRTFNFDRVLSESMLSSDEWAVWLTRQVHPLALSICTGHSTVPLQYCISNVHYCPPILLLEPFNPVWSRSMCFSTTVL